MIQSQQNREQYDWEKENVNFNSSTRFCGKLYDLRQKFYGSDFANIAVSIEVCVKFLIWHNQVCFTTRPGLDFTTLGC